MAEAMIRRAQLPRRMIVWLASGYTRRKALIGRRLENGVRRSISPDALGDERRDPHFAYFQYTKSRDPRIRALERRKV